MPQLVLEFSANITEKNTMNILFSECHTALATMLPAELASCKSRAYESSFFCVGDGRKDNAFVHVALKVLTGRSVETLNRVGEHLLTILKRYFAQSSHDLNLQISLEIMELENTYFKSA
ncbi:MAG: 5-carboxymethyl-2-hydroxymuconate Delta-isomerase [Pseudomonadota bacterium]|nr:5-carboxymethyl-2-hydroxymuconate Delta-isomerase [Pseudomonadota bacterium]